MTTQQELTDKCTPEIIKKMVELAEGFEYSEKDLYGWFDNRREGFSIHSKYNDGRGMKGLTNKSMLFPLLIHRSVEGWNKKNGIGQSGCIFIYDDCIFVNSKKLKSYIFKDYQPTTLTHAECAMLDCLLEVLR